MMEIGIATDSTQWGPRAFTIYDFQNNNSPFHYGFGLGYHTQFNFPDLSINYWQSPYQNLQNNISLNISKSLFISAIGFFPKIHPQYEIVKSINQKNTFFHYASIGLTPKLGDLMFV